jgi:hypothetical protein
MAVKQYSITIESPADEDEHGYQISIRRHGELLCFCKDSLDTCVARVGGMLVRDVAAADEPATLRTPKVALDILRDIGAEWKDEQELARWVRDQLARFDRIIYKSTDEAGWIALRLSCTYKQGAAIVQWAREGGTK